MCSSGIHPYSMQSHYLGTISPGDSSRPPGDVCSGPPLLAGAGRRYWGTCLSLSRLPLLLLASGSVGAVGGEHRGMRDEAAKALRERRSVDHMNPGPRGGQRCTLRRKAPNAVSVRARGVNMLMPRL